MQQQLQEYTLVMVNFYDIQFMMLQLKVKQSQIMY